VRFRTRDRWVLAISTHDMASAEALLSAAGTSPSQRTLSVPLASVASQSAGGVPAAVIGISLLSPVLLFMAAVLSVGLADVAKGLSTVNTIGMSMLTAITLLIGLAIALITSSLRRREAVVGSDGVTLRQGRRATFVPYARMAGVEAYARGVRLRRTDGSLVLLATCRHTDPPLEGALSPSVAATEGARCQQVLLDRIARAARVSRRASADLQTLDRRGRSLAAWRDEVQAMARVKTDYRSTGLSSADLADVVEDVVVSPERRLGAALALAGTDDPTARRRVRVAIDTCADDALRAALEQAAEAELEEETAGRVLLRR
jgi:hypothetical protein